MYFLTKVNLNYRFYFILEKNEQITKSLQPMTLSNYQTESPLKDDENFREA